MDDTRFDTGVVYLRINGIVLPVEPHKGYEVSYEDYTGVDEKTEAGTRIRDVVREGIPSISVSFDCNLEMLNQMRYFKRQGYLEVEYFDSSSPSVGLVNDYMFIDGYKEVLSGDIKEGGIWKVSFTLEDLGYV